MWIVKLLNLLLRSIGPIATAPVSRSTALQVLLPVLRSGKISTLGGVFPHQLLSGHSNEHKKTELQKYIDSVAGINNYFPGSEIY
jgi:hypothetical protein